MTKPIDNDKRKGWEWLLKHRDEYRWSGEHRVDGFDRHISVPDPADQIPESKGRK